MGWRGINLSLSPLPNISKFVGIFDRLTLMADLEKKIGHWEGNVGGEQKGQMQTDDR